MTQIGAKHRPSGPAKILTIRAIRGCFCSFESSYFRNSPSCAGAHPVTHENVMLSSHLPCAALSGLISLAPSFPGLTPWALLRHPFGVMQP